MQYFLFFTLIATSSGMTFNTPGYITLNTQYFNTTDCNSTSYHDTSYDSVCFKDTHDCCENILSEISYLPDRQFDVCYTETINNDTISFLYHCGNKELDKNQSLMFTLSIIGVIFLFLAFISCLSFICWFCFCKRTNRSGYGMIN